MLTVTSNPDKAVLKAQAAQEVAGLLVGPHAVLLLVSGGSALELLTPEILPENCEHLALGVLDERFSADLAINNFSQLAATDFYKTATSHGAQILESIPEDGETVAEFGKRLDEELALWCIRNPEGQVIITQGIGPDGHTAGIFPYPEDPDFFESQFERPKMIVGYNAGVKNKFPERATTTISFLKNKVAHSVVYAVGADKKEALTRVFAAVGSVPETPARVIHEMKKVSVFTNYSA